jgi:hypothetical protein
VNCGVQKPELAGQGESGTGLGGVDRSPQPFVSIGPSMPYASTKRNLVWKRPIDHALDKCMEPKGQETLSADCSAFNLGLAGDGALTPLTMA